MAVFQTAFACGLLLVLVPVSAEAQGPTEAQRATAQEAFTAGLEAARARNWVEAREQFQRAYDAVPVPDVLINLAGAQRQTGLLVEAIDSYERYLREAGRGGTHRDAATSALAELIPTVGDVRVVANGIGPGDVVRLDDRVVAAGEAIRVNPGAHRVEVARDGETIATASVTVAEGRSEVVELDVPPAVGSPRDAARTVAPPDTGGDEGSSSAVVPILIAVAVAAAIAGAIVAIVLLTGQSEDPFLGTFPPGTVEIR